MQGVLFSCFFILIAINGIYAMTYSQSIVGLGPAKGKACPFIQIQGGVQWKPQPIQDACVGKKVNSLFVVEPGTLALCDGTKRGANGLDPLLLGLGALQRPSYLVTSTVTYTAPNCPWAGGIPQSVSRADFKSYLLQLDNRWATYDQICQSEFGSEYVAASPHDAIFAVDGRSPVLNWDLSLAGQNPGVAFNLRGGYGFWLDSSSAAGGYPHSYPWQLGFIWSDCYGGQGSPTYTPRANVQSCSPNNIWSTGALYDSGPSIPQGYAPVLCKKTNLLQYSTFITSTNDTCTSGFGIAYDRISTNGLHQGVRTPVVQPNCGAGYCFNKAENNIVDIDGDSVFPTIDTSTGRPIFQFNTGSGPSCLNTKQGYNEQTCEQTFPF